MLLSKAQILCFREHGDPFVLLVRICQFPYGLQDPVLLFRGDFRWESERRSAHGLQLISETQLVPAFPFGLVFDPFSKALARWRDLRAKWERER
jgi:hypothetical protein